MITLCWSKPQTSTSLCCPSASPPYVHTHAYTRTFPPPPVYERANWLYFTALSKHRIWNELFVSKMAVLCLGVREVILDRRLLRRRNYNGENEQQSGKKGNRRCTYTYRQSLYVPSGVKKSPSIFSPISLLIEIMYHDCWVICFQWLAGPGESLFYIRVRPWGSKQRQPVVMHSSSPLISSAAGRVSLIPPDSCHSPSQCTIVDSDTHRLPHQNTAAVEHTLSHL